MPKYKLTQERLKESFNYDSATGVFTKLSTRSGPSNADVHNSLVDENGYCRAMIDGVRYKLHRLAWLYVYGCMPAYEIDHINGIRDDNRICNLRDIKRSLNAKNQKIRSTNKSGVMGVSWHKRQKRWVARISNGDKRVQIGSYENLFDAVCARKSAEFDNGYHLNHGRYIP